MYLVAGPPRYCVSPAHLSLLGHAVADDLVHRRLGDAAGVYWQPSSAFCLCADRLTSPQKEIAQYALAASGGLTGEIFRLLNTAAEVGVSCGDECIKLEHFEHVAPTHIQ
jgi:hypothetical protein